VLAPLVPLAVTACRGDNARAEAVQQQGEETRANPAEPDRSEEPPSRPPPAMAELPPPWLMTVQEKDGRGVKITSMDIRSFAAPLIEPGDVVLALDGRPVESIEGLERYLHACSPGDMVVLTVLRNQSTINYAMLQLPGGGQAPRGQERAAEQGEDPGGD
jgi:hypothetical protein